MTGLLVIAAALWVATITAGVVLLRKALAEARTPSPCERDAQDGRGEGGEAEFRTIHNEGISS
ncbi:hypothetical protein O6V14_04730 [Sphingomonas faeni]|uniref:hypothetical protein n=1 Tax=Sphingomonas faeni TaxID=185950 RepID=UPI0033649A88